MDKTVQTYLNEYISLIGKGKFMLFGGNDFVDGGVPKVIEIENAIDYYTMVDRSVAAGDVFNRILKTKAEFEKKKPNGSIEIAKGSATDEQYTAFVAEWKTKQKELVPALLIEFERLESATKAVGAVGSSPGLFGGAFATPKDALIASAAISGVLGVVAGAIDIPSLIDYIVKLKIDIKEIEKYLTLIKEPGNIKKISDGILAIIKANADIDEDSRIDTLQAIGGTIYNLKGTTDENIDIIQALGGTIYNFKL